LLSGGWGQDNLQAQIFERALVLEGVHLPAPDGTIQENANIILRGGRIVELGPDSDAPMMSKKLKVKGLFATAGLTDLSSTWPTDNNH
jgi:predicted amidohydrolase